LHANDSLGKRYLAAGAVAWSGGAGIGPVRIAFGLRSRDFSCRQLFRRRAYSASTAQGFARVILSSSFYCMVFGQGRLTLLSSNTTGDVAFAIELVAWSDDHQHAPLRVRLGLMASAIRSTPRCDWWTYPSGRSHFVIGSDLAAPRSAACIPRFVRRPLGQVAEDKLGRE